MKKKASKEPPKKREGRAFDPGTLDRTVLAIPLLRKLEEESSSQAAPQLHAVIVDLNLDFPGGRDSARQYVELKIAQMLASRRTAVGEGLRRKDVGNGSFQHGVEQYVFAKLSAKDIRRLVKEDGDEGDPLKRKVLKKASFSRAIYHIWPDFRVTRMTNVSISTVKCDAARTSFSAVGRGIIWAVLDSGIDSRHPHFLLHGNLSLKPPLAAFDFTGEGITDRDPNGHGTHVAGIIAGEARAGARAGSRQARRLRAMVRYRTEDGTLAYAAQALDAISGMAPQCKLVNMRVLDAGGEGEVSSIMAALAKIQEINGYGRHLLIHGVNLSLGNNFEPEWFACGQSPLCVEVNRLVQSGVVVVVSAGNSGYGSMQTEFTGEMKTGMALSINDPGNAELAITVGSTHREMPHMYGVSYFSSKGPTGDGRRKPDILAPGEKIISCAAGQALRDAKRKGAGECEYIEDSGTSMAAPHVSGLVAAFLSVRREFIGQPAKVKEIFLSTATDLGRDPSFQGRGIVDLMRAMQSV